MQIELQNGLIAKVDEEDWVTLGLSRYTWQAKKHGHKSYVIANVWNSERKQQVGVRMHRLILNAQPGQFIDHIDGDGLNNLRTNLRFASNAQNQQNTSSRRGSSQFKGVSWMVSKGKWLVAFRCEGQHHFVGYFDNEIEAARAYNAAIVPLAGMYARLNPV